MKKVNYKIVISIPIFFFCIGLSTSIKAEEPSLSDTLNWLGDKLVGEDHVFDFAFEDCKIAIDHYKNYPNSHWNKNNYHEYVSSDKYRAGINDVVLPKDMDFNRTHSIGTSYFDQELFAVLKRSEQELTEEAQQDHNSFIDSGRKIFSVSDKNGRVKADTFYVDLKSVTFYRDGFGYDDPNQTIRENIKFYSNFIIAGTSIDSKNTHKLSRRIENSDRFNEDFSVATLFLGENRTITVAEASKILKAFKHAAQLCKKSAEENELF